MVGRGAGIAVSIALVAALPARGNASGCLGGVEVGPAAGFLGKGAIFLSDGDELDGRAIPKDLCCFKREDYWFSPDNI